VLGRIRQLSPSSKATPLKFGIVSALAEGADRLVAREVLNDPDAVLEVALPLPRADYVQDFTTAQSREEFKSLLDQARVIAMMPPSESREAAYAAAGRYIVDRVDVLVALWDGEPSRGVGGTGEIVAEARDRRLPLFCIRPSADYEVYEQPREPFQRADFHENDHYNRLRIGRQLPGYVAGASREWLAAARSAGLEDSAVRPSMDWILPFLARADIMSRRYQRSYHRLGSSLFLAAFLAVAVAAFQGTFMPNHPEIAFLEVALLLALLFWLLYGRQRKVQPRWIAYRALAERLRVASFLSVAGFGGRWVKNADAHQPDHDAHDWLHRGHEEVWMEHPRDGLSPPHPSGAIQRFLASAWLGGQLEYYLRASQRHLRRDRALTRLVWAAFSLTLLAALLHGIGALRAIWGDAVLLAASCLPALAAAFGGIRAEREYRRNAERFTRLSRDLQVLKNRMEHAADDQTVRALAKATEAVVLHEHYDWFSLMQFRDLELHV